MKRFGFALIPLLVSVLLFTNFLALPSLAQNAPPLRVRQGIPKNDLPAFAADQVIIKFNSNVNEAAKEALMSEHGASIERVSLFGEFVRWGFPEGANVTVIAEAINRNPLVEYAHPNFFVQASFVPNDPFYNFQWHFDDDSTNNPGGASSNPFGGANGGGIAMEQAWDISTGSASVVVAVLDTGVAYERFSDPNPAGCYNMFGEVKKCPGPKIDEYYQAPDLANTNFSILPGSDLVNGDDHPNDDDSHGTHVTGTVAQSTNNSLGVAGVAFNTTVMPIKVLDANGSGLLDVIADGILLATSNGADIISMSLGTTADVQVVSDAVAAAFNAGVTVIAACGNSNTSSCSYPAAYNSYVIAVGATQYDETRAPYSDFGPSLDVMAPGGNTGVDQNEDGFADGVLQQTFGSNADTSDFAYWFFQGTSMATPHVSALAALILAVDSSLSPTQVRSVIESTAEDKGAAGRDDQFGFGIIDANAALSSIAPVVAITVTDGAVEFGIVALGDTTDTTPTGTNDVQTIEVTAGPADLHVRSANFSDNGNTWTLSATNGSDLVKWEFSPNGSSWSIFEVANTLYPLAFGVLESSTQDVYFKLTMPTATSSNSQHSATVTIVASSP